MLVASIYGIYTSQQVVIYNLTMREVIWLLRMPACLWLVQENAQQPQQAVYFEDTHFHDRFGCYLLLASQSYFQTQTEREVEVRFKRATWRDYRIKVNKSDTERVSQKSRQRMIEVSISQVKPKTAKLCTKNILQYILYELWFYS